MSVNPRQFPAPGQVFLDHVAIFVDEFERSGAALERLGFTITPFRAHVSALKPGDPLTALGTGNRCAMLRAGFIEVLGPTADTPMAAQLRKQLARYPGLHLIAFSGTNVDEHHAALAAAGLGPLPIARLQRTQGSPDGEREVRASIVRLPHEAWPEGRVQIIFPEMSPDAMWHPSLVRHANHADRLSEVLLVMDDPAARAAQFAAFVRRPPQAAGTRHVVETDRGRLHLATPREAARLLPGIDIPAVPFIAAAAVGSSDLRATRAFFEKSRIEAVPVGSMLRVACLGANLLFHDRADDAPFASL
jgi:hypothetical protein